MLVRGLKAGVQYKFRVAAENYYGTSDMGEESDVMTASESTSDNGGGGMNYDALGEHS
jgi:hypothetical protein